MQNNITAAITHLELRTTETRLNSIGVRPVRDRHAQDRRLEDLHPELVLVVAQPLDDIAAITVLILQCL